MKDYTILLIEDEKNIADFIERFCVLMIIKL